MTWRAGSTGSKIISRNLPACSSIRAGFRELGDISERRFSFVHVDVDLFQPTLDSIRFFYERTNTGGIILCDDYGFATCPGATRAVDEFLADKPEKMISLSGGSGFLIKGNASGGNYWV